MDFDAIIVGSGFGGAITGCRLAEAGYKVVILERGRRWRSPLHNNENGTPYPRDFRDPWIWNQNRPERENGWIDLRVFPHMAVAAGAGVGGGSLIYANISCEAPPDTFRRGWPPEITYAELKPYYDTVARFMNVQELPANQWNPRTKLMKESAEKIGYGDRFRPLHLAVNFDSRLTLDVENPPNETKTTYAPNAQGIMQGTCVHLGTCDIGCNVYAKNTLDRNYIPVAERHGADVRPLHFVTNIAPTDGGYRVSYDRLEGGRRVAGSRTARIVIIAAGSLGSTELLLRCRDEAGTLPDISPFLGRNWSSNGDFLTPAIYADRALFPTVGPTITSAIDFLDRGSNGESFWIEDGGWPNLVNNWFREQATGLKHLRAKIIVETIQHLLQRKDPFRNVMPWFAQGVDAADGSLALRRRCFFFGPRRLHLKWQIKKSQKVVDAIVNMHKRLSHVTGGTPLVPATWFLARDLVTPHPLGGCNMGTTANNGVVDHKGKVFGYKNLYVADGAIIPEALGVNPSRTIGALAERIANIIVTEKA